MKNSRLFPGGTKSKYSTATNSFTLVEMLVSIAVFLILMLLLTQFIVTASNTALSQNARMESLTDARQALDRFGLDWSARVRRPDVAMTATTNAEGCPASIDFITQEPSYSGARELSSVSYQMTNSPYSLQRGIVGYDWSGSSTMTAPASTNIPSASLSPVTPASSDFETLSGDVFRMAICFQGTNGYLSTDPTLLANSTNFTAVVITLATLDPQSRKILTPAQLDSLAAALPVTPLDGQSDSTNYPLAVWQDAINSSGFAASATVPKQVAASVRVYQRIFYTKE
jgi:type II secretory pathway pseudopilin PulG